jgi:hypothetical protein
LRGFRSQTAARQPGTAKEFRLQQAATPSSHSPAQHQVLESRQLRNRRPFAHPCAAFGVLRRLKMLDKRRSRRRPNRLEELPYNQAQHCSYLMSLSFFLSTRRMTSETQTRRGTARCVPVGFPGRAQLCILDHVTMAASAHHSASRTRRAVASPLSSVLPNHRNRTGRNAVLLLDAICLAMRHFSDWRLGWGEETRHPALDESNPHRAFDSDANLTRQPRRFRGFAKIGAQIPG